MTGQTIYRLLRGGAPALKVGDTWRFRRVELDACIDQQAAREDGKPTKVELPVVRPAG